MKIYRCNKNDSDSNYVSWHGSKLDAEKELRRFNKDRTERGEESYGPEGVEAVEIDTSKAGLIAWLNVNLDTDND